MSGQKKIEIHQSSFLSLKAELLRKKQEVHDAKLSEFPNKPTVVRNVQPKTKLDNANEGVSERNLKDIEELEEEKDVLQKSQSALEAKSKLYDQLVQNPEIAEKVGDVLVDFSRKEKETGKYEIPVIDLEEDLEEEPVPVTYNDEEDWIDFVDCLGRTKRCHKDDLESMKSGDEKLRLSLFGRSGAQELNEDDPRKQAMEIPVQQDLTSEDMRRQMLREKWEEEEKKLADRKDIHYQHVLFDEARSHGVGYYSFSTDESERARQLTDLENLRKETIEQQAAAKEAAKRKKKQLQERLRAARRRKRARLGLPPIEETEDVEEVEEEPEKPEVLKREEQTSSMMRPWDMGKKSGPQTYTQEEWIEKRRAERPEEFAPPQTLAHPQWRQKKPEVRGIPEAYLEDICSKPKKRSGRDRHRRRRRARAEIPPPPTFDMHGQSSNKSERFVVTSEMERSIEEGLNFIRRQVEERQMQNKKNSLNVF